MLMFVQIDPNDDWCVIHELEVEASPEEVARRVEEVESDYGWKCVWRIMDPNMGRSPSGTSREVTWQDAFERSGLTFDLADDGAAGRQLVNDMLQPDPMTERPRLRIDPRCMRTIYQMKRFSWDDHKLTKEKDQKQTVKQRNDDYPTMLKYLANMNPTFRGLRSLGTVFRRDVGSYL